MIEWLIIAFVLFLCWGSFLNVVGYRLIQGQDLVSRSSCPQCQTHIAWYDLIPIVSWILLGAQCRSCKGTISFLYPFIELLTATAFTLLLIYLEPRYWIAYGLFFSALIVVIRTDLETMLIPRVMSWWLVPFGLIFSTFGLLPISLTQSIVGVLFGYGILWLIATIFYKIRKIEGMGEGDLDLLALIGSFTGPLGAWMALFMGAFLGTIFGIVIMIKTKNRNALIAFGPWLAIGAILYSFMQAYISELLYLT